MMRLLLDVSTLLCCTQYSLLPQNVCVLCPRFSFFMVLSPFVFVVLCIYVYFVFIILLFCLSHIRACS